MRAWTHLANYDARWKVSTWLFTIAGRLAISHRRRRRPAALEQDETIASRQDDPADLAARRDQADRLWTLAAETLSDSQYSAIWLRYAGGLSVKEIAAVMSKTPTHVKVLLFRGRSAMAGEARRPPT